MATTQQQSPPVGFYAQQGISGGQGDDPPQKGFPPQGGGYPTQPNNGGPMSAGLPYGAPDIPSTGQAPFPAVPPRPPPATYEVSYSDDTLIGGDNFEFSSQTIRYAFMRKVFGILMCQLLVTLAIVLFFISHKPTKQYIINHPVILLVALVAMFATIIAMSCCENIRRKTPENYIFLSCFTLAMSFSLGFTASLYDSDAVLMALGIAAVVCFSLCVFAFQTKWDFTLLSGILFVSLIALIMFGFICMVHPDKILSLTYASLGVILFSFFLVYDTQLIMGGKHKYSVSPEEYIFAALSIYLDIVHIFRNLLRFFK